MAGLQSELCVSGPRPCELGDVISSLTAHERLKGCVAD
jgi:hypothetical protein